ncbi:MAG TPA: rhomboid family intramembrane serine protease [Spirochaetota bacterium]|nr:rhomboid family intramembrane serine protease [Spirochaetota bacterium]HPC42779.1 rhomboid family intramembrane serine protease [Spirochaetota bacterium]HQF07586.1 rhomboid family intramembrane serine protease [Spirochaetota bacterium]HQH96317.1 rhomboid family intramembrane serine protease [Spirochaetota bacterium]HQJ69491.1 rhomboid family intramembrane serine protease [Spirochaetota bacterium]
MNEEDEDYYPDPEDFKEEPRRPPGPLAHFPSLRHGVPAVISFFVCYLATVAYSRYPVGEYLWVNGSSVFGGHEYWRLLTAIVTHTDLSHLLANALIVLVFGWMLKAYFGWIVFPFISIAVGLITNTITIAMYAPGIKLLGASGMAYGMVSLWLVFYLRHDVDHRVPVRLVRAVGFALVMMFPTTFDPRVSYLSHAVGFGVGLAAGFILLPFITVREPA